MEEASTRCEQPAGGEGADECTPEAKVGSTPPCAASPRLSPAHLPGLSRLLLTGTGARVHQARRPSGKRGKTVSRQ